MNKGIFFLLINVGFIEILKTSIMKNAPTSGKGAKKKGVNLFKRLTPGERLNFVHLIVSSMLFACEVTLLFFYFF